MKKDTKDLFLAVATLVGFVVGAGILGLPFVFSKAGFWTGIVNVVLIGFIILYQNLMIGETSLRTRKKHQLVGYTGQYMGNIWKRIIVILITIEWYAAMIAYIIKIGEFFSALIEPLVHLDPLFFSVVFGIAGSYIIYKGLKIIEHSEFWMVLLTLTTIFVIGILCMPSISLQNLTGFSLKNFWFPFGVVLFAFGGAGAIPEMREELKSKPKLMKKAIIIGTIISGLVYMLFPLFIVGVTGTNTTDGAIIGIGKYVGIKVLLLGIFFGLMTMSTSFLAVGLAIKEIFKFDYKKSNIDSSMLACFIPLILSTAIIMLKIDNAFYQVIDMSGALIYPLTGIVLVLTYLQAIKLGDRKPEYSLKFGKSLSVIIIIVFLLGMINKIMRMFF